jgi:hypothetical protein
VNQSNFDTESEEYWQDIFNSIEIEVLPVEYMNQVNIHFKDGTVWEVDIKDSLKKQTSTDIEDSLDELFQAYEEKIQNVDYRMDMDKIKKDVAKRVRRFLKVNK